MLTPLSLRDIPSIRGEYSAAHLLRRGVRQSLAG